LLFSSARARWLPFSPAPGGQLDPWLHVINAVCI
jgi:hypothetical protein